MALLMPTLIDGMGEEDPLKDNGRKFPKLKISLRTLIVLCLHSLPSYPPHVLQDSRRTSGRPFAQVRW
jgi:hypothetical protein